MNNIVFFTANNNKISSYFLKLLQNGMVLLMYTLYTSCNSLPDLKSDIYSNRQGGSAFRGTPDYLCKPDSGIYILEESASKKTVYEWFELLTSRGLFATDQSNISDGSCTMRGFVNSFSKEKLTPEEGKAFLNDMYKDIYKHIDDGMCRGIDMQKGPYNLCYCSVQEVALFAFLVEVLYNAYRSELEGGDYPYLCYSLAKLAVDKFDASNNPFGQLDIDAMIGLLSMLSNASIGKKDEKVDELSSIVLLYTLNYDPSIYSRYPIETWVKIVTVLQEVKFSRCKVAFLAGFINYLDSQDGAYLDQIPMYTWAFLSHAVIGSSSEKNPIYIRYIPLYARVINRRCNIENDISSTDPPGQEDFFLYQAMYSNVQDEVIKGIIVDNSDCIFIGKQRIGIKQLCDMSEAAWVADEKLKLFNMKEVSEVEIAIQKDIKKLKMKETCRRHKFSKRKRKEQTKIKCSKCKGTNITKNGHYFTINGLRQSYRCTDCFRRKIKQVIAIQ